MMLSNRHLMGQCALPFPFSTLTHCRPRPSRRPTFIANAGGGNAGRSNAGRRNSGGSGKTGRGNAGRGNAGAKKVEEEQYLTSFLNNEITEVLTGIEHVPEPLWASWCGHTAGVWVGPVSAFCPTSGKAEPIALADDGKTKLYAMQQCCVEEREAAGDADLMVRRTARATSKEQLDKEMVAGGALQFDPTESLNWEVEELANGQEGLFIFDGGSFSSGPVALCQFEEEDDDSTGTFDGNTILDTDVLFREDSSQAQVGLQGQDWSLNEEGSAVQNDDEDDDYAVLDGDDDDEYDYYVEEIDEVPPEVGTVTTMESCLQWGGEQRVRVKLTLASKFVPIAEEEEEESFESAGRKNTSSNGNGAAAAAVEELKYDLDVDLLRVSITREDWEGAPGRYTASSQDAALLASQNASADKRLRPEDLSGFWNTFEVMATTATDVDMRTGQSAVLPVYTSREVQRLVQTPNEGIVEHNGEEVAGGALWLPHSVSVQLTQGGTSEGLEVLTQWSPEKGIVLGLTRKYSKQGVLQEVVASTSIRAK